MRAEALAEMSDERVAAATEGHWVLCACSWCWEQDRRQREADR
jgi:hypothetical protein